MLTFVRVKPNQQRRLVDGYIRQHSATYIPEDVNNTIVQFFCSRIIWTVTNAELASMKQYGSKIQGPSTVVHDIEFGSYFVHNYSEHAVFEIHVNTLPDHILRSRMCLTLTLKEENIEWRKMLTLSAYSLNSITESWPYDQLPFEQCLKHKKVTLECDINVLSVIYKDYDSDRAAMVKPIKINPFYEDIKFEWSMGGTQMQRMKANKCAQHEWSDYFGADDNFCLSLVARNVRDKMQCVLGLHVVAIPYYLSSVKLTYTIEVFGDDIDFYAKFEGENKVEDKLEESVMSLCRFLSFECVDIVVKLQRIHS